MFWLTNMACRKTVALAGLLLWSMLGAAWAQVAEPLSTTKIVEQVKRGVVRVMGVSLDSPVAANIPGTIF